MNSMDNQIQFALDSIDKALEKHTARNVSKEGGYFHFSPESEEGLEFIVQVQGNGRLSVEAGIMDLPRIAEAIEENYFFVDLSEKGDACSGYGYEVRWVDVKREAGKIVPKD